VEAPVKLPVDPRIARSRRSTRHAAPLPEPIRPDRALQATRAPRVDAAQAVFNRIAGRHAKPATAARPAVGAAAMGSSGSLLRAAQGDDDLMGSAKLAAIPAALPGVA
jgi:hypothetical protein